MSYKPFQDEHEILMNRKFILQRWFYALAGLLTILPVILLTLGQIQTITRENNEFAFYLLLLVHSGFVILSIISTALFCQMTDVLLTILTVILLSAYTGTHLYIHFLLDHYQAQEDFTVITLRFGFVLILLIVLLPWAGIMVHSYQINSKKETICSPAITFSWFLNLDFILIISLLTLNVRSQADFGQYQILTLSIEIPLACLWLFIGKILANNRSRHWIVWTSFYLLSIIHFAHLGYITYWAKYEYMLVSNTNLILLLIITLICGGISVLIHLLTMIFSFFLYRL